MRNVTISQRAMKAMETLPRDIQVRARKAVEYLKTDNDMAIKPAKLQGNRNLYIAKLKNNYRIIYSRSNESVNIVDIISMDKVSSIMRSDK
ncbi:TPA: hypothetical protein MIR57_27945 [Klebsiella pneumoniae]|nr:MULTISPECIES: hypothetical protein [Klebsiella]EKT9411342.1 hypothetical protein [Klebsiella pneumoniae]ELZ4290030.1 hypothetical protein [Klebsiella pneumoniae]ELZ4293409.1 hypothetical protein [Klebsiella pneumoniae]EMA8091435.1 hypothetical protein [Klebsiella pneumoniae]EMA8094328.1 hypothetical protein [Klebsiella pneumoniae]